MRKVHYWHIYADGTGWPDAVVDHLDRLPDGFFDEIRVGIVGLPQSRRAVKMRTRWPRSS